MRDTKDKIKTCIQMIWVIVGLITFIGSCMAATIKYDSFVKDTFGDMVLQIIFAIELFPIFILIVFIFEKLAIIRKLNSKETK